MSDVVFNTDTRRVEINLFYHISFLIFVLSGDNDIDQATQPR